MTASAAATVTPERLLHRIDLQVLRRLDGRFQGNHRTLFHGTGVDFADLREHEPGDDVRRIDWNVTARMNQPYVRQYLEERELTAWLVVDRSSSMVFGSTQRSKALVLAEFVTTLSRLLTRQGDRVGAVLFDDGIERVIEPRSGRTQVLRIAHELLQPNAATAARTDLVATIAAAERTISARSLVVLVSDFIADPGWERPLRLLTRRHDVLAAHVVDPDERRLPDAGVLVLEDLESGDQVTVDTSDPGFRSRYAEAVQARDDALRAATVRAGVDLHTIRTDEDIVDSILAMGARRKHRAG